MSDETFSYEAKIPVRRAIFLTLAVVFVGTGTLLGSLRAAADAGSGALAVTSVVLAIAFIVGAVFATRWDLAHAAGVAIREEAIVLRRFSRKHAELVVPFSALAGFRDGSADFIQLVARDGALDVPAAFLAVPTPDEEARRRLLEHLDGRGVPRLD